MNRQLPHLVANVGEILDLEVDEDDEDGGGFRTVRSKKGGSSQSAEVLGSIRAIGQRIERLEKKSKEPDGEAREKPLLLRGDN